MAKTLNWNDLKIGLLSTAAVIAAALGVLIFGRVGTLHGKTFQVYVTTKAARGVIRGTEVWLDGQKVGLVRNVTFQPPTVDPSNRVVLQLKVLKSAQEHVRLDTRIQVRSGGSVIGDQVVYMTSGTARMRQVAEGDTIRSGEQVDYESMSGDAAVATKEFPAIIENVKLLSAQLRSVNGTLGALGAEGTGGGMQSRSHACVTAHRPFVIAIERERRTRPHESRAHARARTRVARANRFDPRAARLV